MVNRKAYRQHLKRVGQFLLVMGTFMATCVLSYVLAPPEHLYSNNSWDGIHYVPPSAAALKGTGPQVLIDPHSHTFHSDGVLTPEQSLLWHMAMGFNACVVSDHGSLEGAIEARDIAHQKYNDSIKVLLGAEWTSENIHLNLIGISVEFEQYFTTNPPAAPFFPTNEQIQEIINITHEHGGIVMLNHYIPNTGRPSFEDFVTWGVDLIEYINDAEMISEYSAAKTFCDSHQGIVGPTASTDVHDPEAVYGWTVLNVTTFTEADIFAELVAKRTAVVIEPWGSPVNSSIPVNPIFTMLQPLYHIGGGFAQIYEAESGINWVSVALLIAFLVAEFWVIEVLRYGYLKVQAWRHQNREDNVTAPRSEANTQPNP